MTQVFISYSRRDLAFVEKLAADLKEAGLDVWYDLSGLEVGSRFQREIVSALQVSQYVIVVLSPDSIVSEWVEREYLYASNLGKEILPLYYRSCDLPLYFLNINYIDVRGKNYKRNFPEIVRTLRRNARNEQLENLKSRAFQYESDGDFWNALKCWYEIKGIDHLFPNVEIKIKELEEKSARERAERRAARKAKLQKAFTKSLATLKITVIQAKLVFVIIGVIALITLGYIFYDRVANPPLLFFCVSNGGTHICEYTSNNNEPKVIHDLNNAIDWAPTPRYSGYVYFTSNRDDKAEIYRLDGKGHVERVTYTPDPYESWSPAPGYDGYVYFTSNRDGKAEIYRLDGKGHVERVTYTPDPNESWSPAPGYGGYMYFTSNRDGKAEIYRLDGKGHVERVTYTPDPNESWSPAPGYDGYMYFTSNRDGKAEIYRLDRKGHVERVTYTPDPYESWSPVVRGQNIYFTSNRSGRNEVYILKHQVSSISKMESWTGISDKTLSH